MKYFIALGLLLIITGAVSAQDTCGSGLPCGPLPWPLPDYPILQSPTPVSPFVDTNPEIEPTDTYTPTFTRTPTITPTPSATYTPTNTPTVTNTPTATNTALPTATPFFDADSIQDSLATLDTFMENPEQGVLDAEGTPMNLARLEDLSEDATMFFSYVRGMPSLDIFGPLTPVVGIVLLSFAISIFTGAIKFGFPLVGAIIGLIVRIVRFILDVLRTIGSYIPFT